MQSAIVYSTHDLFIDPILDQSSNNFPALSVNRNEEFRSSALPQIFERVGSLIYEDRIVQLLSIVPSANAQFALIKGLIEFCRGNKFTVSFDSTARTLTVDIALKDSNEFSQLLQDVDDRFKKELVFKKRLKKLIDFESRYRSEAEFLYQDITVD
jgi:hypothetical protein